MTSGWLALLELLLVLGLALAWAIRELYSVRRTDKDDNRDGEA